MLWWLLEADLTILKTYVYTEILCQVTVSVWEYCGSENSVSVKMNSLVVGIQLLYHVHMYTWTPTYVNCYYLVPAGTWGSGAWYY